MPRPLPPLLIALAAASGLRGEDPVDFNRDIRPLLNKNCTICHGGVKQAGEVSFLYREEALGKGESGKPVIVPGDPTASELIRRIKSEDPDEKMPPPKDHPHPLEPEQVALLERWIQEGAPWGEHWSFQKPVEPPTPKLADKAWPKVDLDRHVLAKLEAEKLTPSPEASAAEWLRRVSLDLTGLPPSPEEWGTFQQQAVGNPQAAMETAVDRLLASPHFGERWAAMWLDLARYSDTYGFERDPHRDIWPFRDWVIHAFNAGMPFDSFTVKQLAGDLLENPEPGDLIASAFHRNTQNNSEGGTDDEEFRMAAVMDRASTTWTAWNGITFGCVQCHAHPYEPIPHEDYYHFLAYFNNTEDVDLNSDFPHTKAAHDPARQAEVVALEKELRTLREQLNDSALEVARKLAPAGPLVATSIAVEPPSGLLVQDAKGDFLTSGTPRNSTAFTLSAPAVPLGALQVEILPKSDDPRQWTERGAVISELALTVVDAAGGRRDIPLREVVGDFLAGPFDPNDSLRPDAAGFGEYPMLRGPRTGWFVPREAVVPQAGDRFEIVIRQSATCNETQNTVLRRFRLAVTPDPALAGFLATPERAAAWQRHDELRRRHEAIPATQVPVMRQRSAAATRDTRLFIRGNRMALDKVTPPALPQLFSQAPPAANRLDMARWLVGDDNPLAARVLANRLWAELFGIGIVETQEDFGSSGLLPADQALLDHLALRLKNHHRWQIKPFLRELVLSATYRQSGKATPEQIARDPHNRLLARGPRQRLSAEMVRDQALHVSGLLSPKQFGPPVFPPQPEGIWKSVYSGQSWQTSTGEDRYRRAVYTYSKRTSGYPGFLSFDAPSRDLCSARRINTNTPLQALVTLNDPAHIEFAQAFARRMSGATIAERLAHGYRLLTLQEPPAPIVDTLAKLHADALADYQQSPAEAAKLAPTPDEAAMVLVANTLLNSDIALNR